MSVIQARVTFVDIAVLSHSPHGSDTRTRQRNPIKKPPGKKEKKRGTFLPLSNGPDANPTGPTAGGNPVPEGNDDLFGLGNISHCVCQVHFTQYAHHYLKNGSGSQPSLRHQEQNSLARTRITGARRVGPNENSPLTQPVLFLSMAFLSSVNSSSCNRHAAVTISPFAAGVGSVESVAVESERQSRNPLPRRGKDGGCLDVLRGRFARSGFGDAGRGPSPAWRHTIAWVLVQVNRFDWGQT